jgi:cell division control protein 45
MVRKAYQEIHEDYSEIKASACGRQACTVMIFVANEIDAMASTKMLTQQLRTDNVAYTIRSVFCYSQVKQVWEASMTSDIKSVFMINCGATMNIPKLFDIEYGGDVRIYVLDNHRPFHLANIHSLHNVVLFDDVDAIAEDEGDIPSDGSMLSSDEDKTSSDDDDSDDDVDNLEGEEEIDEESEFGDEKNELESDAELADDDDKSIPSEVSEQERNGNEDEVDSDDRQVDGAAAGVDAERINVGDDASAGDQEADIDPAATDGGKPTDVDDTTGGDDGAKVARSDGVMRSPPRREDSRRRRKRMRKHRPSSATDGDGGIDEDMSGSDADAEHSEDEYGDGDDEIDADKDKKADGEARATLVGASMDAGGEDDGGDDDDDDDDEGELAVRGRRRKALAKEYDPRLIHKNKVLRYYSQGRHFAPPTSVMIMNLVCGRSSSLPLDLVWYAILGVTDQYQKGNIGEDLYSNCNQQLEGVLGMHMDNALAYAKYTVPANPYVDAVADQDANTLPRENKDVVVPGAECGNIVAGPDLRFFLYRHWPLYDSMTHSQYMAVKMKVWKTSGIAKMEEMLAKIGVPLMQCKQSYNFMGPFRDIFRNKIASEEIAEAYNLTDPGPLMRTFYRYNSFKNPVSASDVVHAAAALAEKYSVDVEGQLFNAAAGKENVDGNGNGNGNGSEIAQDGKGSALKPSLGPNSRTTLPTQQDAFNDAYDCLGMKSDLLLSRGINEAVSLQQAIMKRASVIMEGYESTFRLQRMYITYVHKKSAYGAGSDNRTEQDSPFSRPQVLIRLGHLIMDMKSKLPRREEGWTGKLLLPLILLAERPSRGTYLVVGISPLHVVLDHDLIEARQLQMLKILGNFRRFFSAAAKELNANFSNDSFEANVVEIAKADVHDFIGTLDFMFKKATSGLVN